MIFNQESTYIIQTVKLLSGAGPAKDMYLHEETKIIDGEKLSVREGILSFVGFDARTNNSYNIHLPLWNVVSIVEVSR